MDVEEVILFPGPPGAPAEVPGPTDEAFAKLHAWIGAQLTMAEAQLRKHKEPAKPDGITPAIAAYLQAREVKAATKASREAYMKALQKADHYGKRDRE